MQIVLWVYVITYFVNLVWLIVREGQFLEDIWLFKAAIISLLGPLLTVGLIWEDFFNTKLDPF